ncbi:MAG: hypothetical protein KDB90_04800 [Planctomycetes bacterium]|nr:hypothetical protein [Planctomycetota bacterium]
MRNYLVLAIAQDIQRLSAERFEAARISIIVCPTTEHLPSTVDSDALVIAISSNSMGSTAYQELVLTALKRISPNTPKWLLMLDHVQIPLGFAAIRQLPELHLREA